MQQALEHVAECAPQLTGDGLVDALADTGWVDRETVQRLLPSFRHFDPDRHFAENLRRLSFRGRSAADAFRAGICCLVQEITGSAEIDQRGPEPVIRFRTGDHEGLVIAHPEVAFTIGGTTRSAIAAAVEEMPDAVVVVARNFERGTSDQLASLLALSDIPGTLVTINLLLGIRAMTLRYRPPAEQVLELLGSGGALRSAQIARLGDRPRTMAV